VIHPILKTVLSTVITVICGQKKTGTQGPNKTTSKGFPSLCDICVLLIGPHVFVACMTGLVYRDVFGAAAARITGGCAARIPLEDVVYS
jgi:hypothetical protein